MPSAAFILNRRETLIMEQGENDAQTDEWVDDDELFDDFVVLLPPDMQKYNTHEKLDQERSQKNQGDS